MPAIASTGEVSLSDLATEFNDTQPNSMSEFYRNGDRVPGNNSNVPTAGLMRISNFRGAINQIEQTASNASNVSLSTVFGSDWASTVPKVYTVPSGVTVGGTSGTAAITASSTMQGTLTIEVTGSVIGTGGAVAGSGGDAISNAASGVTLTVNNGGLVAGGGGGGGAGGTGGNGYYSSTSSSSPNYSNAYRWYRRSNVGARAYWGNGSVPAASSSNINVTTLSSGNATYTRGVFVTGLENGEAQGYKVSRTATTTTYTNGGGGGSGGVGQGYNQTNASGSAGASGGTNAGAGGTGGAGGTYGNAGGTGGTGANGNSTNGSAGSSGGSAGAAVSGTALSAYTNNGTVNGTVST